MATDEEEKEWASITALPRNSELAEHLRAALSRPRPMMRTMMYSFPLATIDPGVEQKISVPVLGVFRAQKLMMHGAMDEIRGHYRIKRTRLPWLNRDDVIAYSTVRRNRRGQKIWFTPIKTWVEFSGFDGGQRAYKHDSVEYIPIDPLEYVALKQMTCGTENTLPAVGDGVPAPFFRPDSFGNAIPAPTTDATVSLLLKNIGDIQVRVRATIMGPGLDSRT